MNVLVIGISAIVRRRILPALLASPAVERIHLASRRSEIDVSLPDARRGQRFTGYQAALDSLDPCLAYVSLPNCLHAQWTRAALEAGFHVIVDKPAFLDLRDAEAVVDLATHRQLCLAEATVWPFHPQLDIARQVFAIHAPAGPQSIQAVFTFPRPAAGNFRLDPAMGGGSFNDLCAYAVSSGRVFFGGDAEEVWCRVLTRDSALGIDTAFSLTVVYSGGHVMQGVFGFGLEYQNALSLVGSGAAVSLDPAFSSPHSGEHAVRVRMKDISETRAAPGGDSFRLFIERVINSIQRGDWAEWPATLLQDAGVAARAAKSAGINRDGN